MAAVKKRKRLTKDQRRIAELEAQVSLLIQRLDRALLQIPNVNLPRPGWQPFCPSHTRLC